MRVDLSKTLGKLSSGKLLLGSGYFLLALSFFCHAPLQAEEQKEPFTPRENAWSIGTSLRRMELAAAHEYKLHAISPSLDIGRGWLHKDWWSSVEVNLTLGPNSKRLPGSPPLDFTGTGLRMRIGHSWPKLLLRKPAGDWGGEFGIEYSEWNARSYRQQILSNQQISSNWVVRSRWIFLQPALFYSLWQAPRPQGHKPEWINTRIEGLVLSLGLSVPIQAQMQASYLLNNQARSVTDHWQGTVVIFSSTCWLGI